MRSNSLLHKTNTLFKIDKWWIYKIGCGVFSLILFKELFINAAEINFGISDLLLFGLLVLLAVIGHFINDYSDYQSDKLAQKKNIFNSITIGFAPYFCLTLSIVALVLAFFHFSNIVFSLVALQILGSVVYSLKPLRFKERGLLSLIITGYYERLNPYLIILVFIAPSFYIIETELLLFSIFYLAWSYTWEYRNFINGQLIDLENDRKSNIKSFVLHLGIEKTIRIQNFSLIIEITFLIVWCITLMIIDLNFSLFLAGAIVLMLIQYRGSKERYSKITVILDNWYSNNILASLLITLMILEKLNPLIGIGLLLLFQYRIVLDVFDFVYYRIRYVVTVSWSMISGNSKI